MPQNTHPAVGVIARSGITYRQLAERTGYCPPWISRVLHGKHPASPTFRAAISAALAAPEHELFNEASTAPATDLAEAIRRSAARLVASRVDQGLPATITDPAAVEMLAELVRAASREATR